MSSNKNIFFSKGVLSWVLEGLQASSNNSVEPNSGFFHHIWNLDFEGFGQETDLWGLKWEVEFRYLIFPRYWVQWGHVGLGVSSSLFPHLCAENDVSMTGDCDMRVVSVSPDVQLSLVSLGIFKSGFHSALWLQGWFFWGLLGPASSSPIFLVCFCV